MILSMNGSNNNSTNTANPADILELLLELAVLRMLCYATPQKQESRNSNGEGLTRPSRFEL